MDQGKQRVDRCSCRIPILTAGRPLHSPLPGLSVSKLIPLQTGNDYPRDLHWVTRWRVSQNDHLIEAGRDEIADHPLDISENIAGAMVNAGLKLRLGEG